MGARTVGIMLAVVFAAYLGLSFAVPPIDDELYYWCWAKDLQWSYYDHPPMTALMIRASTEVFGDNLFAIRLPACIAAITVLGVLAWLTKPRGILIGALLSPVFSFGAVIITPDTPLLLFWSLYLAWLVAVHRRLDNFDNIPRWVWAIGGALLGCGILGKYTAGLAVPAGLLSFLYLGRMHHRRWMPGYGLHLATAFVTSMPILIHNIRHGFAPLLFQWRHSMVESDPGLQACGEFLGVQVLLVGTMPLLLLPWVWKCRRELLAQPLTRVCVCLYALPLVFFILKSTRGPLQGNWALASYLGFWPLAAVWWNRVATTAFLRWGTRLTFGVPVTCVALLGAHLAYPFPMLPVKLDRITYMVERNRYAERVAKELHERAENRPVFAVDYQWVSFLRFYGVDARQLAGVTRSSHFTQRPEQLTDHPQALFFSDYDPPESCFTGVAEKNRVADVEFAMRGTQIGVYHIWECRRAEDWNPPNAGGTPGATLLNIPSP